MNKVEEFLINHKDELIEKQKSNNKVIDKLKNHNFQIELKITDLTKNLDTTFEVFSPNSVMNNYNVTEINKLKNLILENESKIEVHILKQKKIKKEIENINNVISSYETIQKNIEIYDSNEMNLKKEEKLQHESINKLAIDISEMEIMRVENKLSNQITYILDNLLYKEKLCEEFLDVDVNRSKLELIAIKEGLSTLQSKAIDFMFHVKHKTKKNNFMLVSNITNHIKKYDKKPSNIIITRIGTDILMPVYDIENNIRIIDELINNSIIHGRAKNINIQISITNSLEDNEIVSIVDNDKIDLEVEKSKKINYDLKIESSKYRHVNISISDDGVGFDKSNIIYKNNTGLSIVKKRIDLFLGNMEIKSSNELGTIVNYDFNYSE